MTTLLQGIVGSTAYGLATANSDTDRLAVHVAPVSKLLGFGHSRSDLTTVTMKPDRTSHDVGKFLSLVLNGNPTVTEMLWLDSYEVLHPSGQRLIEIRKELLGAQGIYNAYCGYAKQQFVRLQGNNGEKFESDTGNRTAKHARHCVRLLMQADSLLSLECLSVQLTDTQKDICWAASEYAEMKDLFSLTELVHRLIRAVDCAVARTRLPLQPNRELAEQVLRSIRLDSLVNP